MPEMKRLYVKVEYGDKDITAKVEPYLVSLDYVDNINGELADKITVKLGDAQRIFQGPLYPLKGAALYFEFGYSPEDAFKSGRGYQIDNITVTGSGPVAASGGADAGGGASGGDVVTWTALANIPSGDIHTRRSVAWQDMTLENIAKAISERHKIALVYECANAVSLPRIDQLNQSDLALLKGLTKKYGLFCSLKAGEGRTTLLITDQKTMKAKAPVYKICRKDTLNFSFNDYAELHTAGRYVRWFDPRQKKLVECEVVRQKSQASDGLTESSLDTLEGRGHKDRAVVRQAMEVFAKKSSEFPERKASIDLPGNPLLLAGTTVELPEDEWGNNTGVWIISESKHTMSVASGYKTTITLKQGD